jgi:hypothetical protein
MQKRASVRCRLPFIYYHCNVEMVLFLLVFLLLSFLPSPPLAPGDEESVVFLKKMG